MLSEQAKKKLLEIARRSIEEYLKRGQVPDFMAMEGELLENGAAFVTLHKEGMLRGCIGFTEPLRPLYQTVRHCAIYAATQDNRFPPVTLPELEEIELEISVLSPLQKVENPEDIQVGYHGLMVCRGPARGLLLPQVATEYGWDRNTFLNQTCRKAGLAPEAWKKDTEIYYFHCEVFGEEKAGRP